MINTYISDKEGVRLDAYISDILTDVSRSKIKKLIGDGKILRNDKKEKASAKISINDVIKVDYEEENIEIKKQDIKLDIVYEDDDVLVVNKMRGMVVHPANGNLENTLVNALLYYLDDNVSKMNGEYRAGIVHRIDKDTSGLLVVAKNDYSAEKLIMQLKDHSMTRQYTLICHGVVEQKTVIETNLGRSVNNRLKYAVVDDGKYAHTTIIPIEIFEKYTYAKAILKTGRTHQIRVHMRHINRPLVGDKTYSNYKESIEGQLLHAGTLGFIHPRTEKYMEFSVDEPEIFAKELRKLRNMK